MAAKKWAPFPYPNKAFHYDGDKLAKAWPKLHAGDQEPFPDEARIARLIKSNGKLGKLADAGRTAERLQEGWIAYHAGEFQHAFELGVALGPLGASLANKASGIHAMYLVRDEKEKRNRFQDLVQRAEEAIAALPNETNSHYFRAFGLGRYSQLISIAKALAQGLAGKVKDSLDATLKLAPKHAEAHTALGLYHAEIVGKVGGMIAGLTYGAKASAMETHCQTALQLTPDAPIAWIEYANALLLVHGKAREDEAAELYAKAVKLKPKDAMEALDIAAAKERLA